jgi:hypothetical protein
MERGFIFEWDFVTEVGRILGCSFQPAREFPFRGRRCCLVLQQILERPENGTIHVPNVCPGIGCIQVTFDVDMNGEAINVCTV